MNLYDLNQQLNSAQLLLEECQEYKSVQSIKNQIKEELSRLKSFSFPSDKEALMDFGFECRTGYEIELDPPDLNEPTEEWTYIIIHKSQPKFKLVWFNNSYDEGLNIKFGEEIVSCDWSNYGLGLGSDEEKAWKNGLINLELRWKFKGNLSISEYVNT